MSTLGPGHHKPYLVYLDIYEPAWPKINQSLVQSAASENDLVCSSLWFELRFRARAILVLDIGYRPILASIGSIGIG
jgi:hypothetical protein